MDTAQDIINQAGRREQVGTTPRKNRHYLQPFTTLLIMRKDNRFIKVRYLRLLRIAEDEGTTGEKTSNLLKFPEINREKSKNGVY